MKAEVVKFDWPESASAEIASLRAARSPWFVDPDPPRTEIRDADVLHAVLRQAVQGGLQAAVEAGFDVDAKVVSAEHKELARRVLATYLKRESPEALVVEDEAGALRLFWYAAAVGGSGHEVATGAAARAAHALGQDIIERWVAQAGLTFAIDACAASVRVQTGGRGAPSPASFLLTNPVLYPASPARQLMPAFLTGASPADRDAALARMAEHRATGGIEMRLAMSAIHPDPQWIADDLRDASATTCHVAAVHVLNATDLEVLGSFIDSATSWNVDEWNRSVAMPLALLSRWGERATALVEAWMRRSLADRYKVHKDTSRFDPEEREVKLARLLAGTSFGARLATLVSTTVANKKFVAKANDPRPWLQRILRDHPAVSLPFVREAARSHAWAKELLPQLERQTGTSASAVAEASLGDVPTALTARAIQRKAAFAPSSKARAKTLEFWTPGIFHRPELTSGQVLPASVLDALGDILAADDREASAAVRAACNATSLERFAWDVFQAWLRGGAPSKEKWALTSLGVFGNDDTVRRLTPLIREWPREASTQRSLEALSVLERIGTDAALSALVAIARKVKFKKLQAVAGEMVDRIAKRLGLTADELADRVVPDFDLDDDGSKTLVVDGRAYRVGFDEALAPFVVDDRGKRLKDLKSSTEFKLLKKDVRGVASEAVARLEHAMVQQRRWKAADFLAHFVQHPLMVHLARRLVWGTYSGTGGLDRTFRVTEDRSFASSTDERFDLSPDAVVGIVHRTELDDQLAARWGTVFGEYEIVAPFEQLARGVFHLSAEELQDVFAKGGLLARYHGRTVEPKTLMGFFGRQWRRGEVVRQDVYENLSKALTPSVSVSLDFAPGLSLAPDRNPPRQSVTAVRVHGLERPADATVILLSELLRELEPLGAS